MLSGERSIRDRMRGEGFRLLNKQPLVSSRLRAAQNPQVRPQPNRDDGCRPMPTLRHMNSKRNALWQLLPATKLLGPTEAGFQVSLGDPADLLRCSPPPPEYAGCRLLFGRPYRGACQDREASQSRGARVNALGIGKVDRADGDHLHR